MLTQYLGCDVVFTNAVDCVTERNFPIDGHYRHIYGNLRSDDFIAISSVYQW